MSVSHCHQGLCLVTEGSGTAPEGGEGKGEVSLESSSLITGREIAPEGERGRKREKSGHLVTKWELTQC